jgi:hypothetical protein
MTESSEFLAPCPCGETPSELSIMDGDTYRWRRVCGNCCGMWEIEVRVNALDNVEDECRRAWNDAPREGESR